MHHFLIMPPAFAGFGEAAHLMLKWALQAVTSLMAFVWWILENVLTLIAVPLYGIIIGAANAIGLSAVAKDLDITTLMTATQEAENSTILQWILNPIIQPGFFVDCINESFGILAVGLLFRMVFYVYSLIPVIGKGR
jgi:hypothetical protein